MAKRKEFNSPVGIGHYPCIVEPNTTFNPEGVWKCGLILDPENNKEHKEFIDKLTAKVDEYYDSVIAEWSEDPKKKKRVKKLEKQYPFEQHTDADGNELSTVHVKFKKNAVITSSKTGKTFHTKVPLFNGKGEPCTPAMVCNGSLLKIRFSIREYAIPATNACGITLGLEGVQIIELVDTFERTAEDMGFTPVEGDNVYDGTSSPVEDATFDESDDSTTSEEDGDF